MSSTSTRSIGESGGSATVVVEESAKAFVTDDFAGGLADLTARFDQVVAETLMISFLVKMGDEFLEAVSQRAFAEEDHSVESFCLQAEHEPFDESIAVGASRRQNDRFDLGLLFQEVSKRQKLRIAIDQNVSRVPQKSVFRIGQCTRHLPHPRPVRMSRHACNLDAE